MEKLLNLKNSTDYQKSRYPTRIIKNNRLIVSQTAKTNGIRTTEVDDDPRAAYFRQVKYGKYIRMALILKLINQNDENNYRKNNTNKEIINEIKCNNPSCITTIEQELDHVFVLTDEEKNTYRCKYCEHIYKKEN